jgi:hypothetical protein
MRGPQEAASRAPMGARRPSGGRGGACSHCQSSSVVAMSSWVCRAPNEAAAGVEPARGPSAGVETLGQPTAPQPWAVKSFSVNIHLSVSNNSYGRMYI